MHVCSGEVWRAHSSVSETNHQREAPALCPGQRPAWTPCRRPSSRELAESRCFTTSSGKRTTGCLSRFSGFTSASFLPEALLCPPALQSHSHCRRPGLPYAPRHLAVASRRPSRLPISSTRRARPALGSHTREEAAAAPDPAGCGPASRDGGCLPSSSLGGEDPGASAELRTWPSVGYGPEPPEGGRCYETRALCYLSET